MKLTKKLLEKIGIHNGFNYAAGKPYLYYTSACNSPYNRSSSWSIYQKGKNLGEHWTDDNAKVFAIYSRTTKQEKFDEAVEWMRNKFGIEEVVKTPMGTWMDKSFVEQRNKQITEFLEKLKRVTNE